MPPCSMAAPSTATSLLRFLTLLVASSVISRVDAVDFQSVPSPDLDLSELGRVAFAGNFDSISLYSYAGQDENGLSTNGSQSILGRFPNGAFTSLQSSDGYIEAMCPFMAADGTLNGIIVGGNFTSLGGQQVQAVGLFDPTKDSVTPLPGLKGQVSSLYCDNDRQTVYFGGSFSGGKSTNAIAWTDGWTNLPFAGFNGPVTSIDKLPNGNIVFGGEFTGIGNMKKPDKIDEQVVNVGSAKYVVTGQNPDPQFNSSNIYCTSPGKSGPGTSFILADNTPGSLQANFQFGFTPTKLRLLNSQVPDYSTNSWYFSPYAGSILNFTYYDANGLQSCTNECPLANNGSYQDFFFVNKFPMNSFTITITGWNGKGGGLGGIELFQNTISSYAVDEFNEPHCDHLDSGATSKTTGSWQISPPEIDNISPYLTTELPQGTLGGNTDTSVTFLPNVRQSGKYKITVWTPGCVPDNSCATRGVVNITGELSASGSSDGKTLSSLVSQTQEGIHYDIVYIGNIDAAQPGFRPSITLAPAAGQAGPLTVVAQFVDIQLMSVAPGLNGLYEFDPNEVTVNTNFNSPVDTAATQLNDDASFLALAVDDTTTYAAGGFSSDSVQNILSIKGSSVESLANNGLNDVVQALWHDQGHIYAGGNFSGTADKAVNGLNNVAAYDTNSKTWKPLGAGVNGIVYTIVPLTVNVSGHGTQSALGFSGYFSRINAFEGQDAHSVLDVAVWIPSLNNWLQNVDPNSISVSGRLNSYTSVPGSTPLWSGTVDSQLLAATDVVRLSDSPGLGLQSIPVSFDTGDSSSGSRKVKRVVNSNQVRGVATGMFYSKNNMNLTILGGQFTAAATNGDSLSNLVVVDGSNNNKVTGLESDSASDGAILALDTQGTTLFAGGSVTGGVVVYDLARGKLANSQPPKLTGRGATVNTIATRPGTSDVYVGGSFTLAGSLGCAGLCVYDAGVQQWNAPGSGLPSSSTINVLEWAPSHRLILAGDLRIKGKRTMMANYDAKAETFTAVDGADTLPGPITAYTSVDSSFTSAFVAGTSKSSGSSYLAAFDGDSTWTTVHGLGKGSEIQGLQLLGLDSNHDGNNVMNSDQVLLVTGALQLPRIGPVSAALYDGSQFTPFVLSTNNDGTPGSISQVFVQNTENLLTTHESFLALGFIVLIGLACALGSVFLLVVLGILVERVRRRREGYVPAPTGAMMYEKSGGGKVGKIAPEELFSGVGSGGEGPAGSRL